MYYVYDLILKQQLMGMFTSNVDITACIVGAVAEFPSSYISTSVFFLLSPSCDRNLHYICMAVLLFFS